MAALEKIRSHGKLIAICVGGALLAFVLGDFDRILATLLGAGQTTVAKINGTKDFVLFLVLLNSTASTKMIISLQSSEGCRSKPGK